MGHACSPCPKPQGEGYYPYYSEGGSKKGAAEYNADELKREHQKEEAAESMAGRF